MPPILVFIAFAAGLVLGVIACAIAMGRRRGALERDLQVRVLPVLERRAHALNLPTTSTPQVNVAGDGELQLDAADPSDRVLKLADAIDEHEHTQLGFVDTIRVSKEDVDRGLISVKKKRRA